MHIAANVSGCRTRRKGRPFAPLPFSKRHDRTRVGRKERSDWSRQPGVRRRTVFPCLPGWQTRYVGSAPPISPTYRKKHQGTLYNTGEKSVRSLHPMSSRRALSDRRPFLHESTNASAPARSAKPIPQQLLLCRFAGLRQYKVHDTSEDWETEIGGCEELPATALDVIPPRIPR